MPATTLLAYASPLQIPNLVDSQDFYITHQLYDHFFPQCVKTFYLKDLHQPFPLDNHHICYLYKIHDWIHRS